mmetsp:Transcript_22049/g.69039  ORF Transcript_22049/g.69039 Transcript_22049/m.69039 type:complete len:662 (-) Transcript_22049:48-2033(-)
MRRRVQRTDTPETAFVEGLHSQVARRTEHEVGFLSRSVDAQDNPPLAKRRDSLQSPFKNIKGKRQLKAAASEIVAGKASPGAGTGDASQGQAGEAGDPSSPQDLRRSPPASPKGELAQAIAERLRIRRESSAPGALAGSVRGSARASQERSRSPDRPTSPTLQASFASTGKDDGPWTSKFTASMSPGALNRWTEQRPDPGWYRVQLSLVQPTPKSADFREHPKHKPLCDEEGAGAEAGSDRPLSGTGSVGRRSAPASPISRQRSSGGMFLTSVDAERDPPSASAPSSPKTPSKQVQFAGPSQKSEQQLPSPSRGMGQVIEQMALAKGRPDLGRIGRVHVLMHEVSYPAEDLGEQDIKGYRKQRCPSCDFSKNLGRPEPKEDDASCPGKYDVNDGSVKARTTGFVEFGRALPRSVPVTTLGHIAPEAAYHPEEKRAPGACIMDRSRAKDSVRQRITHVNNYDRDMGRPPPPSYKEYHNTRDPKACEAVLRFMMEYDADKADRLTTHRRDSGPSYATMIPRGRAAVQGNRALSHDVGVRSSVGLGTTSAETGVLQREIASQREPKRSSAVGERSDLGPQFDHYTLYQTTTVQNNFVHGSAPVHGVGPKYTAKPSPMRRAYGAPVGRKASRGFTGRVSFGGPRVPPQARTYEAMAIPAGDEPPG